MAIERERASEVRRAMIEIAHAWTGVCSEKICVGRGFCIILDGAFDGCGWSEGTACE